MEGKNISHRHHIIICHLPGYKPALQRTEEYLVASHIREVAVDMHQDKEEKTRVREQVENKYLPKLLGKNLTCLL